MSGKIAIRGVGIAVGAAALGAVVLLAFAFVPTLFGAEALIVTSGSMGDAAPIGSVAVTRLVDGRSVSVGDVISFKYPTSRIPTTHRVIEVATQDGIPVFRTKGDANPAADPVPVPISGRVHRVERVVPYAGRIVVFARTPAGGISLFLVPIVGLFLDDRRRKRARTKGSEQTPVISPPEPRRTDPDVLVLGALAGLVVGSAVAMIGARPKRR